MTTGGRGITAELAQQMAEAGLHTVSVSVDGLEVTHDLFRASPGSFQAASNALKHLKAAGLRIAANTNFNRLNQADVEPLYERLRGIGIVAWQLILTVPLGRAADRAAMLLQPWDLSHPDAAAGPAQGARVRRRHFDLSKQQPRLVRARGDADALAGQGDD